MRERHSSRLFISLPEPDGARTSDHLIRSSLPAKFRQSDMARTRGAKSSSPSSRKRVPRGAPVQGPTFDPPRPNHLPIAARACTFIPPIAQIPHGASADPRDFFYPRVAMDFYQSMTTKQRPCIYHTSQVIFEDYRVWTSPSQLEMVHILSRGASTNPHLLRGKLPPSMFLIDALLRHNIYPLQHWTQRRGVLLEALFKISEGYFFGPHHLIMAALLYFEEKVHKKKLQRADAIPLLFPRLLCQILEHLRYPSNPQLERKRICREVFTLDKWNNMTAYRVEQPGRPQPATRRASPRHIPEDLTASQSSLAQEMAAIRACQKQMLATQAQHTAILRQLQHYLSLPSAAEHLTPPLQCHTRRP
ncbi:hypothetical protein CK203_056701 [Vitis vinifera]|uniref:Uncharacterized protein n=1 Tax=Vitis vinifera TaxID=29760 RepID=A0A438GDX9_VITVI|nr:hypothetical protein CK203_055629 [Vitis vinifera]RVW70414.1 hypothetical protein CK203_056701 [Vitis vinifera]